MMVDCLASPSSPLPQMDPVTEESHIEELRRKLMHSRFFITQRLKNRDLALQRSLAAVIKLESDVEDDGGVDAPPLAAKSETQMETSTERLALEGHATLAEILTADWPRPPRTRHHGRRRGGKRHRKMKGEGKGKSKDKDLEPQFQHHGVIPRWRKPPPLMKGKGKGQSKHHRHVRLPTPRSMPTPLMAPAPTTPLMRPRPSSKWTPPKSPSALACHLEAIALHTQCARSCCSAAVARHC